MPHGQADNTVKFTFGEKRSAVPDEAALRAAVTAEGVDLGDVPMPGGAATPKPAEPAAVAAAVPAAAAPEPDAKVEPAAPVALDTKADDLRTYKITVDGQELEVTEADLKAGHMRQRDYTQKTQKLATREREIAAAEAQWRNELAQRDAELQALDRFLQDRAAIEAYMGKAFGAPATAVQQPQLDPSKPITSKEVADIARYNAEQVRLATLRDVNAQVEEARATAQTALDQLQQVRREKVEHEVERHISVILDKFPVLRKMSENIEDDLMGEAARYLPRGASLDDAKARLTEAAERRMANIRNITEEAKKAAAVAAADLRKTGAEPAGGTAPKPPAGKKLTLDPRDRTARLQAAQADVEAFLAANQLP